MTRIPPAIMLEAYYSTGKREAQVAMIDRIKSNELKPKSENDQAVVYQIRIKGHLGDDWTDWFGGMTITLEENGDTLLTGPVVDQAALFGLLRKVRDLGMPLLSVIRLKPGQADASDVNPCAAP